MLRLTLVILSFIALPVLASPAAISHLPMTLTTSNGELYGSLMLPRSQAPMPVALLIAGSGPTDRNGNNPAGGNNDGLKKLAQTLSQHGIASLRYDKRGVVASYAAGADERRLSVEQYAADAAAWGRLLLNDRRFSRLVLVGHSEGALIAALAAPSSGASALVSIAGPAYPIAQVLDEQLAARLPAPLLASSRTILQQLLAGRTTDNIAPALQTLFRPSVQPYLISLFRQNPAQVFAALRIPTLIVQGTHDAQVSLINAQVLMRAKPDSALAIIDGMNHVLRITAQPWAQQKASYNDASAPLANALGREIVAFIRSSAGDNGR